jgi:hypothetical protein
MRALGFDRQSLTQLTRTLGITSLAAAALLMAPSPAQALPFPPSPRDVHNRIVHDVRHVLELPRAIHRAHVDAFRSFYRGQAYYGPHHHYHAVYRYPVYGAAGHVYYRPYSYCNDALFIAGGVPVPRIVVSVRPGGYYYAPPPPPPPPCGDRRYERHYDDGHRGYDDRDHYDNRDHYDDRDHDDDHDRYDQDYDHDRYDDGR